MKTSELLRRAKGRLARDFDESIRGKTKFVCRAICVPGKSHHHKAEAVVERIALALGDNGVVATWLSATGVVLPEGAKEYENVLQAYRHRWLDALIAEYEAEGD